MTTQRTSSAVAGARRPGLKMSELAGEVEPEQAVALVRSGSEPLRELIGAMHSKLLLAELERQRGGRAPR